jgi:hypothetical protein
VITKTAVDDNFGGRRPRSAVKNTHCRMARKSHCAPRHETRRTYCSILTGLCVPTAARAATIRVPADAATIQQAIDAAAAGDTVLVAPGTYVENIHFRGKAITVESEQGPAVTIIDGNRVGSVVTFAGAETRSAVPEGATTRSFSVEDSCRSTSLAFDHRRCSYVT